MPMFPKAFARRKSAGNALDLVSPAPPTSASETTFKVFERGDGASKSFDGGAKLNKAATAAVTDDRPPRSQHSLYDDNIFADLKVHRYASRCTHRHHPMAQWHEG